MARPWCATYRIFALLFGPMVVIWLIVQIVHVDDYPHRSLEETLKERTESGIAHVGKAIERCAEWGWPTKVFGLQRDRWFAFAPGQTPQPVPGGTPRLLEFDYDQLTSVIRHHDPTVTTRYWLYWPGAVLQIALMQIAGAAIAVVAASLTACARRRSP